MRDRRRTGGAWRGRRLGILLGLCALLLVACGGAADPEAEAEGPETPAPPADTQTDAATSDGAATPGAGATSPGDGAVGGEPVSLVAMHGSSPDFISLVPAAAWDICAGRGIDVEYRFSEDASTVIQAMAQGAVQIGTNIGVNVGVPAVEAGADVVDVIATQRPTWALAVRPDIDSFDDLEGATIAVHGEQSFTRAVADWYAEREGFSYEQLIIPGSEVRAEALAQGQIDASVIDLPDVIQLSHVYPGEFEVLATVGETFPDLIEQDIWLDANWLSENPDVGLEVVTCLLEGIRRLDEDAEYALNLATETLPEMAPEVLQETIMEYQDREIWPRDGLLTRQRAQETLDFFFEVGEIDVDPQTVDLEDYFNFALLEEALANVGG